MHAYCEDKMIKRRYHTGNYKRANGEVDGVTYRYIHAVIPVDILILLQHIAIFASKKNCHIFKNNQNLVSANFGLSGTRGLAAITLQSKAGTNRKDSGHSNT